MSPKFESGRLRTVEPMDPSELGIGDIVLRRVHGAEYRHLVKAIRGARYQIEENRGRINGWIGAEGIFGNFVNVEP